MGTTDDHRYAALTARDARYDGVFFVGVRTTGVYCRPICPARTPKPSSCEFYASAALAEKAGYRACFRCRPECAPGHASSDAVEALVARATARIAEGALDRASVDELAEEFGVSGRQLRRALEARLGVAPLELAQTQRLALAKQLIHDTELPITEVAFAAGFRSVRRFNAVFAERMGTSPIELRRSLRGQREATLVLRLDYRAPFAWDELLAFLAARAVPGVELVDGGVYRRVVAIAHRAGVIEVRRAADRDALHLAIDPVLASCVMAIVVRVRRLFDLDARPDVIAACFAKDPLLAPLVAKRPGLRVPGMIDTFEGAVRALLGQQVSVAAATTLAGRFVAAFGTPLAEPRGGLTHRFPTAREIATRSIDAIAKLGLPGARAAALHAMARAIDDGTLAFDERDLDAFLARAVELPGIGPWTANYLAMRALHLPDAFPAADLGIKHATGLGPKQAEVRAEAWRPFRSYAVLQLWTSLGDRNADDDADGKSDRSTAAGRKRDAPRRRVPARAGAAAGDRARARS